MSIPYVKFTSETSFSPEQVAAKIEIHPIDHVEISAGSTAVLTCIGYGVPLPILYWSRGATKLTNNSHLIIGEDITMEDDSGVAVVKSSMEICSSRLIDAGIYSCTAANNIGNDSFTFTLTVKTEEGRILVLLLFIVQGL